MHRTPTILLVLGILTALAPWAHAEAAPSAPSYVAAVDAGGVALVSWAPAPDTPLDPTTTMFNVYGVSGGVFTLLDSVPAPVTSLAVVGGFDTYGVSVTLNGVESRIELPCVGVDLNPPPSVYIDESCE